MNSIMSFPALLIIWLAVLVVAYAGGWVAHIMDRRPGNLSGAAPGLDPPGLHRYRMGRRFRWPMPAGLHAWSAR